MKRLLAITILTIGLLPSIPVFYAGATIPSQSLLIQHCRNRLGYTQTEPLFGSAAFQLRRCITNTKKQFALAEKINHKLQRHDQHFWKRYEYGQHFLKESQRSLDRRMQNQERLRTTYYKNTSVQKREADLTAHRRSRRTIVREKEQQLLRERRAESDRWSKAIESCTNYPRAERESCLQRMLTR